MSALTGAGPGAIALVGSGEYTAAMTETDRLLLARLGGPAGRRVLVLPTASAAEPGQPERWAALGVAHFRALGATVAPVMLLTRDDAADPRLVDALAAADLYYFSGGDPHLLVETLRDTPAWAVIQAAHRAGATIAGCSAGAMMLGGRLLDVRAVRAGQPPRWPPALGPAAGLAVLPHFDRAAQMVSAAAYAAILASAPAGVTLVGVDEETALVRLPAAGGAGAPVWRVTGRQTVTVFGPDGDRTVHRAGETLARADGWPGVTFSSSH